MKLRLLYWILTIPLAFGLTNCSKKKKRPKRGAGPQAGTSESPMVPESPLKPGTSNADPANSPTPPPPSIPSSSGDVPDGTPTNATGTQADSDTDTKPANPANPKEDFVVAFKFTGPTLEECNGQGKVWIPSSPDKINIIAECGEPLKANFDCSRENLEQIANKSGGEVLEKYKEFLGDHGDRIPYNCGEKDGITYVYWTDNDSKTPACGFLAGPF